MFANVPRLFEEVVVKSLTVISAGALMLVCGNVMAQDTQEVKVEAIRVVSKDAPVRSPIGFPMTDLSLTYGVSLAGLNLATYSGATEAEKRVNAAARAACREIGHQYPDATPGESECTRSAAKNAMVKVHDLVAAAEKTASR
jgi:UrcA family protein